MSMKSCQPSLNKVEHDFTLVLTDVPPLPAEQRPGSMRPPQSNLGSVLSLFQGLFTPNKVTKLALLKIVTSESPIMNGSNNNNNSNDNCNMLASETLHVTDAGYRAMPEGRTGPAKVHGVYSGLWLPQGKSITFPVEPRHDQPCFVFTGDFTGCSLIIDQLTEFEYRAYHVEGGKMAEQYEDLQKNDHGLGQAAVFHPEHYSVSLRSSKACGGGGGEKKDNNNNKNKNNHSGNTFVNDIPYAFAFLQYDRRRLMWSIYFQRLSGTLANVSGFMRFIPYHDYFEDTPIRGVGVIPVARLDRHANVVTLILCVRRLQHRGDVVEVNCKVLAEMLHQYYDHD